MRILITRREHLDVPDGINIFIFSLADSFTRLGHEVILLSTYESDQEKIKKYYGGFMFKKIYGLIRHTPNSSLYSLAKVFIAWMTKGRELIRNLKPDFCIFNGVVPFMPRGIPVVFVSHDLEPRFISHRLRNFVKRISYNSAVCVVATTSELKEELVSSQLVSYEKITIIPTCIKLSLYQCQPVRYRRRAILHIGTAFYKNPEASIRSFEKLGSQDVELLITGEPSAELQAYIARIQEPTLREKIRLLGRVSDMDLKRLLGEVRVVSVPSIYKTPVASPTVLESFAAGTPVVTTNSITRDIAVNGFNCLVCKIDTEEFAEALKRLLYDDILWERLSENARLSVKEFDADKVAERYLELYETHVRGVRHR
ncbi:MAG: glycosyltransferase family 4 protein [Candidatus Bathyarchaeia archaeon]